MARNIQLLAAEESNVGRVADPAGGSWYVESLTDQLAQKAWARFGEIEAAGGMAAALADGRVADLIGATVAARGDRLATRKQPITGVSMFPGTNEQPLERPAASGRTRTAADWPAAPRQRGVRGAARPGRRRGRASRRCSWPAWARAATSGRASSSPPTCCWSPASTTPPARAARRTRSSSRSRRAGPRR